MLYNIEIVSFYNAFDRIFKMLSIDIEGHTHESSKNT